MFYAVGENTLIEAAQPLSPTGPESIDMERAGEGIYSVKFETKDLKRAAEHLRSKGQRVAEDADSLVIDREDAFGMVIGFTESEDYERPQMKSGWPYKRRQRDITKAMETDIQMQPTVSPPRTMPYIARLRIACEVLRQ